MRLSEVLRSISPDPDAVIVRMNIEGAEALVIDDILTSGFSAPCRRLLRMWTTSRSSTRRRIGSSGGAFVKKE